MKESYLFDRTFNNIIFKGRNQAYGAYKLRQVYHRHIIIAAILAIAIFTGGIVGPLVNSMFFSTPDKYEKPVYTIPDVVVLELPPLPVKPEPKQVALPPAAPEKVKVATKVYADQKIVKDDAPVKESIIANQDELKNANFGTEKIEGVNPETLPVTVPTDPEGIDGGTGTEENTTEVFNFVEDMPQYEGGFEALAKYLGKKMRYPAAAKAADVEGTVVVTFVVGRNGDIEDVEVLKGLGFGTDEEAIRVVKSMPRWQPGKQNGMPVAVRYTLPIKFALKN
ncbi:TonB family protein [Pontibacter sp. H259]|uniref:energy transducer TonB n=1 Tax=Pontibacter sp. H259 TaxID=3133421 RepID=UPI0030BDE527